MKPTTMTAGRLRDEVTVQAPTDAKDSRNQPEAKWCSRGTFPACVEGIGGQEYWQAQQVVPGASYRVTLRYQRWLHLEGPSLRLVWNGVVMNVVAANPLGEKRVWLELTCKGENSRA